MDATLPAVAEELLKEIEKVFHEMSHGHLSIVTNCPQSRWEKRDRQFVTVAQETELQKSLPEAGSDITRAEDHRVPDDHLRATCVSLRAPNIDVVLTKHPDHLLLKAPHFSAVSDMRMQIENWGVA
ncbi:zinc finger SWIM domain-containing protein 7 isoform X3 [Tiliqua scincoides]|uniref:zinc finger SWIM domain-containing protein 7 isoform X3 n=1 Tax=Tiliqua scincoides TaxID=71010 RepID=UPI003462BA30